MKLEKCPLCGGDVEIRPYANPKYFFVIVCTSCKVEFDFWKLCLHNKSLKDEENAKNNKLATINRWNNRTEK